jgi:hypothetical protein
MVERLSAVADAMVAGVEKFVASVPVYTRQQFATEARRSLNSSRDNYMSALSVKMNSHVLVVELDRSNWLANAVESGIGPFDMKEGILKGKNAKVSKKGYRYASIPIGKDKNSSGGSTEKGQDFQKKINEVLSNKPNYGISKYKQLMTGPVIESQKIMNNDPQLQGFYRTRQFDNREAATSKKSRPSWQLILFRTVSENPESKALWQHPGVTPKHLMRRVDRWLNENLGELLNSYIDAEVKSAMERLK